uniref:hypothetical protein n=1 Tax=Agathobacter sp. TaxID=2021311 RepID=UPI003FEFC737
MKKRLASIALALTLCIGMMPTAAWAEDDGIRVQNIQGIAEKETMISANWIVGTDSNGGAQTVQRDITDKYFITADKTEWNDRSFFYLVKDDVTIDGDVTVGESVSLCLCDNATLTINGSVKINRSRGQLHIMGQSTGDNAGRMIVNNPDGNAFECLDSTSGTASGTADIIMYSGRLEATGEEHALGENVYLYKAWSTNSTPILCVADRQKVRATASKANPDEPYWIQNDDFSPKSFTLQWCDHENEEWEYFNVDDTNHYKVREWCNWRDGGANGVEPHNKETKPTADGKGHSGKCQCGYGSDQVQEHTWDKDKITCTVCHFKKAARTSNGNLYDDVATALAAEPAGGTVTLEADVTAPITISSAVTLGLNGKTVTSLTVNDPAAKIKDSGETKGTITKLTAGTGVTLGSLCEDGYGWKSTTDGWSDEFAKSASNVRIAEAPIKSVTINGEKVGLVVTKTYGQSGVKLTGNIDYGSGSGTATQKWYQVKDGKATEISEAGSLAYGLPAFLDAGTHIYRLTVTIDGYSKSCDATVTVNPADIKGAQIVVSNEDKLVFTPGADGTGTPLTAYIVVNRGSKGLTAGTDYTVTGNEATDAGTHTLTITGTGNYTGTETARWEIQQHTVTVPTIPDIIKTYDGTTDLPADFKLDGFKSESTGNTVSLTAGTDYTMTTAHYTDADVGKEKTVRLTLTMRNPNYVFEGRKTIRDLIVNKTFYSNTNVVINQDAMPEFDKTMSLNVVNNQAVRYQVKLPALPQLSGACNYGGITYKIKDDTLDKRYYRADSASVDKNGVLTLPIQAVAADTEGSIGTIRVLVRTRNYQDAVLTVNVSAVNKIVPQKQSIDVSTITYGEPLSKAGFTAFTFVEPGTSNPVAGTLAWKEPDKRLEAGTQEADWVFTPADGAKYAGAAGTVNVTVDRAKVTGAPKYTAITQSGKTVSDAALTVEGGTFSRTGSVKWVDNAGNALPADTEVKQGTAYKWLFTPADTKNYHTLSGEIVLWAAASNGGSSNGGLSAPAESSAVVTVENKAGASTEVITKTTVKDAKTETTKNAQGQDVAKTTAVVSEKIAEQLVNQAVKNKSDIIEITVSPDGKNSDAGAADSVKSTELTLPKSTVTSIAKDTDADLVIRTGHGEVVLDNKTLQTMASKAGGDAVQIVVSENTQLTDAQKSAADVIGSNGRLFDLAAKIGDSQLHDFEGGKAHITLPVPKALKGKEICVVYINDEGLCEIINHSMETIGGDSYVKFTASHFSTFAIVENTAVQDQAQWKARLNQAGFKAVTAKTEKKNVRIRLAVKKDKKLIAELGAMGYTVKYRFYRSQKKSTGYKALATKKNNTFVSTKGTKGKKYYYKVKVLVYDNDKLLAQTKLGQCSAGAKKWNK